MKKIVALFFFIGFLVYSQTFFNGFVGDDIYGQIVSNYYLYGFNKIPTILIYHWSPYYKPVFYISLNIFLTIFGNNAFPLHLFQLIIHILNTTLIFLLFSKFFKKNISFILALVFLIHPAISEAVLYISALQDVLYSFFGLLALNVLVLKEFKWKKIVVFLLLGLSIFSKETGVAFLILAAFYKILFNTENFKKYLLGIGLVFSAYFFMRSIVLHVNIIDPQYRPEWTSDADFLTRLITIPKIIFKYISLFIFPDKLQITQIWWVRVVNFPDFYFPLAILLVIFSTIFIYGFWQLRLIKKEVFPYLFFAFWLILGFGLHSQIITLDATFSERWFYLPIVGILGTAGFVLNKINLKGKRLKAIYIISALIILLLSMKTFVRSFNWVDDQTLLFHDAKVDKTNIGTSILVGNYYLRQKDYDRAIEAYKQTKRLSPGNEETDNAFANIEIQRGNLEKAKEILERSPKNNLSSKTNYSFVLSLLRQYDEAKSYIYDSLKYYPNSDSLYLILAYTHYSLGNRVEALNDMQMALKLGPANEVEYGPLYEAMKAGREVRFEFK